MSWQTEKLGSLGEFRNGLNYSKDNFGVGLKVISVKDFGNRIVPDLSVVDEINPAGVSYEKSLLKKGDIIFVRSNGNKDLIGRSMYIDNEYEALSYSGFCIRFRIASDKVVDKYLSQYFRSPFFRSSLSLLGSGTNISNLNQPTMGRIEIPIPPISIQTGIVEHISAYDDLIANNERRIALLERSAQLLFEEWFVRLRYPGHEHDKIINGVPHGWDRVPFSDVADFINGFAFKPRHLGSIGYPIVKIPELKEGIGPSTPRYEGHEVPDRYVLNDGDLLFSWSGTLAVDYWIDGKAYLNQHLFLVAPKKRVGRAFLLLSIRDRMPQIMNQSVGATMKHIRRSALDTVTLLVAPKAIQTDAEQFFEKSYSQVMLLRRMNRRLSKARDLLLPRLMDGRISV